MGIEPGAAENLGGLLRKYRERAKLSQSGLARLAHLDASFVNRVESGQRGAEREPVEALIGALQLPSDEADQLLAAAGHLPAVFVRVGLHDATLQFVARILAAEGLSEADRDAFRRVIAGFAAHDPTLQLVAKTLTDDRLSPAERETCQLIVGRLGLGDPTLRLVARILADDRLSLADRDAFRQVVDLIGQRWRRENGGT